MIAISQIRSLYDKLYFDFGFNFIKKNYNLQMNLVDVNAISSTS